MNRPDKRNPNASRLNAPVPAGTPLHQLLTLIAAKVAEDLQNHQKPLQSTDAADTRSDLNDKRPDVR